jgi:hypothetical protein
MQQSPAALQGISSAIEYVGSFLDCLGCCIPVFLLDGVADKGID